MSAHGRFGIRSWRDKTNGREGIAFFCPGCQCAHSVSTRNGPPGSNWSFNGDYDNPVLSPSVRVFVSARMIDGESFPEQTQCHSFVGCNGAKPGEIIFLGDSHAHQLRGAHPLIAWPENYGFGGES